VATLFGAHSGLTRLIHALVGLAALYGIYMVICWGPGVAIRVRPRPSAEARFSYHMPLSIPGTSTLGAFAELCDAPTSERGQVICSHCASTAWVMKRLCAP